MCGNGWKIVRMERTRGPDGGSAWLEGEGGDCGRRVIRGGSWFNFPVFLRSSYRSRSTPVTGTTTSVFVLPRTPLNPLDFILLPFSFFLVETPRWGGYFGWLDDCREGWWL